MFLDSMIDYKSEDPDIAMGNRKSCKSIIKTTIVLQENYSELQHFCASLSIGQSD